MSLRSLWIILLINGFFALVTNLFFLFDAVAPIKASSSRWPFIGLGLIVYGAQISLIYWLMRRYAPTDWLDRPFRGWAWIWGTLIALLVWLIANAAIAYQLPVWKLRLNSLHSFTRFLSIFLLSSLPGALIEEYLFRYLPVRYAESVGMSRQKTVGLFLMVLLFFTVTHIPAYLWQYKYTLSALWSPLTMGFAFFFVYYATRNLAFTVLFHAFHNQAWVLFGPARIKDYSLVIMAGIVWFMVRTNRQRHSPS